MKYDLKQGLTTFATLQRRLPLNTVDIMAIAQAIYSLIGDINIHGADPISKPCMTRGPNLSDLLLGLPYREGNYGLRRLEGLIRHPRNCQASKYEAVQSQSRSMNLQRVRSDPCKPLFNCACGKEYSNSRVHKQAL